jgi:hypothetical protein
MLKICHLQGIIAFLAFLFANPYSIGLGWQTLEVYVCTLPILNGPLTDILGIAFYENKKDTNY